MKPRLFVSIIAVVALMIAGAATIVLAANQPPRPQRDNYYPRVTRDANQPPECARTIELTFRSDAEMFRASVELDNDTRFYYPIYLTQAQNYEQLKRSLAGQPELLGQLRPESVPATATLRVSYSESQQSQDVINDLEETYGPAKVADPCALPTSSSKPTTTGTTTTGTTTPKPTTARR